MAKDKAPFDRLMDKAWLRDKSTDAEYTGEALVLACLLKVRKGRNTDVEKELERIMRGSRSRKDKK